jgi:hypothetical protein
MMTSPTTTTTSTTVTASRRLGQRYVATVLALAGAGMVAAGMWAGIAPRSFARLVAFPYHEHFLHDLGAFQVGIGATRCLRWPGGMPPRSPWLASWSPTPCTPSATPPTWTWAAAPATPTPSARCRCWPPSPWCYGYGSVAPPPAARDRRAAWASGEVPHRPPAPAPR